MRKKEKSKTNDVLSHLKQYKTITSLEAFELYGVTRLSSIIFNLRAMEYPITTKLRTITTRYGIKVNIAVYNYGGFNE